MLSVLNPAMRVSRETDSATFSAAIHAVALPAETTTQIVDAAEAAGFGFRQYPDLDSLLESLAPSSQGCILIAADALLSNSANLNRINSQFHSMPVIAFLNSNAADLAVELMKMGVFSVLTRPFEHQNLVAAMTTAIATSAENQATVDSCRNASIRMAEATEKELEVLQLIMAGRKNKEIAARLGITVRAVEDRRFRLMKKVGVDSVAELVALAVTASYYEKGFSLENLRNAAVPEPRHCLKGIEVWTPSADETTLSLTQGCYRDADTFRDASQGMKFRRGEGLPGRVWAQRSPAFLKELITNDFVRIGAAGADGVTTAVGFPIFSKERVKAVILLLLDSRHEVKAAFESWRVDPDSDALRLVNGTYVNCERLRRLSEFIHLPLGEGLAGFVAEQGRPYIGSRFPDDVYAVRGLALSAEQLVSGIALPLTDCGSVTSDVFLLLNSEANPVFSTLQVWKFNGTAPRLVGECVDGVPSLTAQMARVHASSDSLVLECFHNGQPVIADTGTADRIVCSPTAPAPSFGVAIPTLVQGKVVTVTVLAN